MREVKYQMWHLPPNGHSINGKYSCKFEYLNDPFNSFSHTPLPITHINKTKYKSEALSRLIVKQKHPHTLTHVAVSSAGMIRITPLLVLHSFYPSNLANRILMVI